MAFTLVSTNKKQSSGEVQRDVSIFLTRAENVVIDLITNRSRTSNTQAIATVLIHQNTCVEHVMYVKWRNAMHISLPKNQRFRYLRISLISFMCISVFIALSTYGAFLAWRQARVVRMLRLQGCEVAFHEVGQFDFLRRVSVLLLGDDGGNFVSEVTITSLCGHVSNEEDARLLSAIQGIDSIDSVLVLNRGRIAFPSGLRFKNLRFLTIHATKVDFCGHVGHSCIFPRLEYLDLRFTKTNDRELSLLTGQMPELQTISLTGLNISGEFLSMDRFRETLSTLNVEYCSLPDDAVRHLEEYSNLVELTLNGNPLTDNTVGVINKLHRLQSLRLSFTNVTLAGVAQLRDLKRLNSLEFGSWDDLGFVDDSAWSHVQLPCWPQLRSLCLFRHELNAKILNRLATLRDLNDFFISYEKLDNSVLLVLGDRDPRSNSIKLSSSIEITAFFEPFKNTP